MAKWKQPEVLTLVLDAGEWSEFRPGRLAPVERASDNHWTRNWVSPSQYGRGSEKNSPIPCQESNVDRTEQ